MKLTKQIKDDFVYRALKDIPEIDYKSKWQSFVLKIAVDNLPENLKLVWNDNKTKPYLNMKSVYLRNFSCMGYVAVPMPESDDFTSFLNDDLLLQLKKIHQLHADQRDSRNKARELLESAINSVNTLKQAKEALPQFLKYLPEETTKSQLPAVLSDNLIENLKNCGLNLEAS